MIVCGTGHRPEACEEETVVRIKARTALRYSEVDVFITGMAAGFDLWAGDEARKLGVPLWCAKPWTTHKPRLDDTYLYETLIDYADEIVNVTEVDEFPGAWVYYKRNEWMVDNATHVLAYLNPEATGGGTYQCVKYARGKKPIRNIYEAAPF